MNWLILAHSGQPLAPHDLWTAWNFEPSLLLALGAAILVYLWGTRNVWKRAGAGHGITLRHFASFLGAVAALLLALLSPLDELSNTLFSAHMTQHLVLILIAAPLLVMCDYPLALVWALPRRWAHKIGGGLNQASSLSRAWRVVSSPVSAWLLFTIALWAWHAPVFYQAALRDETIHVLEHLVFLWTAMLFWWVLIRHTGADDIHYGIAVPYLFSTAIQSGIFGALMTFTNQAWYSYYTPLVTLWGLTPLQDQQLAGIIMWIPGGAVFTLLTIGYFAAWLRALERRSLRHQHFDPVRTPQDREKRKSF